MLNPIDQIRVEVADTDSEFPILPDSTYIYLLNKHSNSIGRSSLDAARMILMQLSQRTDETVDIFSVRGSKAAESYREALKMYIKDPYSNPVLQNVQGWVGGVFIDQMQSVSSDSNMVKINKLPEESDWTISETFGG